MRSLPRESSRESSRGSSRVIRWLAILAVLAAVGYTAGFFAYGFFAGAPEYLSGEPRSLDCETPGSRFLWRYEAVNYVPASDELANMHLDQTGCSGQFATAGTDVVAADGVHLAAWYVPAAIPAVTSGAAGGSGGSGAGPRLEDDTGTSLANRDELERAFTRLDPDHAVVVVLRFYADLTVPQIAIRLGIAEGTVKSRLHHALRRLRTAVEHPEETQR